MGLIILEASEDYCFVETEEHGEVGHYRPSLVCAEKQHMVTVNNLNLLVLLILVDLNSTENELNR